MPVPFVVRRTSEAPLHRQIYQAWREAILAGRFRPGARVPSTRAFAATYGVSRVTVAAAYDQLAAEGYFEAAHGSGTFVATDLPDDALRPGRTAVRGRTPAPPVRLSRYGSRLGPIQPWPAGEAPLDLSRVGPDLAHFPFTLWRRLVSRQLRRGVPACYRAEAAAAGYEPLRAAIAAHLGSARAVHCSPGQVIVVNGSQQALDLCARLLLDEGDEAAVEEPGYRGARQLFAAHGAAIRSLPVGPAGASIDRLTSRTRLVHVTPSHQLPIGVSMSLARRLELLEWARAHGGVILEDDYDSEYRYSGPPLPAMHGLADGANVIYLGTFSNVMFRGLRLGYLVVPAALAATFATAKWMADRHSAPLEQAALAEFIAEGHFERHIRRMRRLYKRRRDVLLDALTRHFEGRVSIKGEAAGMHLTVRFRNAAAIRAAAARHGVRLASTAAYYRGAAPSDEFILGFSALAERSIREAVRRLGSEAGG